MSVKRYRILYGDPSWRCRDKLPGNRGASCKYTTMPIRDIMAIRVPPTFDDALLFLWRIASMVPEAYDTVKAWRFTAKSEAVWIKTQSYVGLEPPPEPDPPRMFGMGHYVRNEHESLVIAGKGRYAELVEEHESLIIAGKGKAASLIECHKVRSTMYAPRPPGSEHHSRKPDVVFDLINALVGDLGPRAELFATERRDGYDAFGDELGTPLSWGLFP